MPGSIVAVWAVLLVLERVQAIGTVMFTSSTVASSADTVTDPATIPETSVILVRPTKRGRERILYNIHCLT